MHPRLRADLDALPALLGDARDAAIGFVRGLPGRPAARTDPPPPDPRPLPEEGPGAAEALRLFRARHEASLSGSAGPRYLAFVTGGTTPAALAADWLASAYDQNVSHFGASGSGAAAVEAEAIWMLRDLLSLPSAFSGVMVTGGTMANVAGLAAARQWAAGIAGVDVAEEGVGAAPPVPVLAASPHASIAKALAILGMGRRAHVPVATLPGREAMDVDDLHRVLEGLDDVPSIVCASAGTATTGDFDDVAAVADLCRQHGAWLHVDGAFGMFAAASPGLAHLVRGAERADSLALDAHKWLNVPYDCGVALVRRPDLLRQTFRAAAAYLDAEPGAVPDPLHLGPENSRRFRALPVWVSLHAYGREGFREIVERDCRLARELGERLAASADWGLLAPVRLNVVCFRPSDAVLRGRDGGEVAARLLKRVADDGRAYLSPARFGGHAALRAAFSGWATEDEDLEQVWTALEEAAGAERDA